MTREQFLEFRPKAENLIAKYRLSIFSQELKNLVDSQTRHLFAEYDPDSLFEKLLDMQPGHVVLLSAMKFYHKLFESQSGTGTDKTG
jgi:hypothetical protein